jgi:hypothetical protein
MEEIYNKKQEGYYENKNGIIKKTGRGNFVDCYYIIGYP